MGESDWRGPFAGFIRNFVGIFRSRLSRPKSCAISGSDLFVFFRSRRAIYTLLSPSLSLLRERGERESG